MLRIPFEWLELAFECFESRSNGWNWHSNASNPNRMVGIGIRMLRIPIEWLELAFEYFESRSNGSQPWLLFTILDSTLLYRGSTSLY